MVKFLTFKAFKICISLWNKRVVNLGEVKAEEMLVDLFWTLDLCSGFYFTSGIIVTFK